MPPAFHQSEQRSLAALARALVALVVGTTVGCRVGPDFGRPGVQSIQPEYQRAEPWTTNLDPHDCWWRQYDDPTLDELVAEALDQNLSLREAAWRVLEARARFRTARGAWFPDAAGTGNYSYRDLSENAAQFNPGGAATRAFDFYSLGFDSTWEIDLFGRIARSVESAAAEAQAESESLHDVKVTLIADVVDAYLEARSFQARMAIAERNVALQEKTLAAVRSRLEAGLIGPLDAAQAESNLLSTKSTIPQLKQALQTALNRLAFLLGTTPSERNLIGPATETSGRFGKLSTGIPAALLAQRPDIRRAEREAAAANALIGVAIADRLPIVTLRGTISAEARDVSMLFESAGLAHSVGPSIRWNVLNFGRLRNVVEARKAAYQQSLVRYQATALQAVREVEDGLTAYEHQQERADRLREAVDATRRAERLSQHRYEEGLVTFQRVLDTQRELAQVEGDLETSSWEVLRAMAAVYRALGAGWRCSNDGPCEADLEGYTEQSLKEPTPATSADSTPEGDRPVYGPQQESFLREAEPVPPPPIMEVIEPIQAEPASPSASLRRLPPVVDGKMEQAGSGIVHLASFRG